MTDNECIPGTNDETEFKRRIDSGYQAALGDILGIIASNGMTLFLSYEEVENAKMLAALLHEYGIDLHDAFFSEEDYGGIGLMVSVNGDNDRMMVDVEDNGFDVSITVNGVSTVGRTDTTPASWAPFEYALHTFSNTQCEQLGTDDRNQGTSSVSDS